MKTKTGMSIGLALTLMVGVFATMLALGLFTNTEVRANNPTALVLMPATGVTLTTAGTNNIVDVEENTTAVGTMGATHDTTADDHPTDEAVWSVTTEDIGGVDTPTEDGALFSVTEDGVLTFKVAPDYEALPENNKEHMVELTLAHDPDEDDAGAGTANVTITINVQNVENDISTADLEHTPGGVNQPAKITVTFTPESPIAVDESIIIVFSDHVQEPVSGSLSPDDVTIRMVTGDDVGTTAPDGTNFTFVAEPAGVTLDFTGSAPVNDPRVRVDVGDMVPGEGTGKDGLQGIPAGAEVTVTFRQSAGFKNPTEGGSRSVAVTTSADTVKATSNKVTFIRTLSLSSASGDRGKTVTVTGVGFRNSTDATVWIDRADANGMRNNEKDADETELCTGPVGSDDTFTCSFVVNPTNFEDGENEITISAVDGYALAADPDDGVATWELKGKITVIPSSAAIGDTVTVEFRDFPSDDPIKTFKLGGIDVSGELPSRFEPGRSRNETITIPDNIALGRQSLEFNTETSGSVRRFTITILGAQITVTPGTVVPNQTVTVTGSGFTADRWLGHERDNLNTNEETDLSGFFIGNEKIGWENVDDGEDVEIDSGGTWVATVVIPVVSPATTPGTYEFKVTDSEGRPGATRITVADRTISFTPEESRSGTIVTVNGAGWPASNSASGYNATLSVDYVISGNVEASVNATPDSDGNFNADIKVPLDAKIPSTNEVRVSYEDDSDDRDQKSESAAHRVPGAQIEISPVSGPGGTRVTLTGAGFKAFTSLSDVSVGSVPVQENPSNPVVGRDGVLAPSTFLIPGLDPGTHTIRAKVGEPTVSVSFTITADDAPLATTAEDTTPDVAFKELIDSGSLLTVFWYNEDTQSYLSYDPDPANAGFNDLETVGSGDIFWVRLSEDANFLGKLRRAEWAQVVLP